MPQTPAEQALSDMRASYRHQTQEQYLDALVDLREQVNDEIAATRDAIAEVERQERGA